MLHIALQALLEYAGGDTTAIIPEDVAVWLRGLLDTLVGGELSPPEQQIASMLAQLMRTTLS